MASPSLALLKSATTKSAAAAAPVAAAKVAPKAAEEPKKASVSFTKKAPAPAPVPEPEPEVVEQELEAAADGEEISIDVDKMSAKELDALVTENAIETPVEWKKWSVGDKRKWLNDTFSDDASVEEDASTVEDASAEEVVEEVKPAPVTKAVATTKKTTTVGKAKTSNQEILGPDALSDVVQMVENLKEPEARKLVLDLSENGEYTFFRLGGVMAKIQADGWFKPFATFREFVEKELGMEYRKAMYWVNIYNALSESHIPWEKVKGLGWTKLKEIASILTVENVEEWAAIASKQTTLQLVETVKNAKLESSGKAITSEVQNVTTKTFKVHDDQKKVIDEALEKAKEEGGTTFDTVALEYICMSYLGAAPKVPMKNSMVTAGLEATLEALQEAYPDHEFAVTMPE